MGLQVRFFTRGEFSSSVPPGGFLPPGLPLKDFTQHQAVAAAHMFTAQEQMAAEVGKGTLAWFKISCIIARIPAHVDVLPTGRG